MRSKRLVFLSLIVSLATHACGDSDSGGGDGDGPACQDSSCGGKLEGSWKLDAACYVILSQPELGFCPEATAALQATKVEGSLTFDGDTYERHTVIDTDVTLKLPAKCQEKEGGEKTECVAMRGTLSNGATLICADADNKADGCECGFSVTSESNDSGELSIRGNKVTLVGEELDYCVKDGKLSLQQSRAINMSGTAVTSQLQTSYVKN